MALGWFQHDILASMQPYSIYIHIPYCRHRCGYCDFNTYAGQESLIPKYVQAICREIEIVARNGRERLPVHTIFFGGGTPTLLPADGISKIMQTIRSYFDVLPDVETTVEANPGTVTLNFLKELRIYGVKRISLGVQSSIPDELHLLERQHDFFDAIHAFFWARQAGFDNINLDLIYGLPDQRVKNLYTTFERVLHLGPDHLSHYSLTIQHDTPMRHWLEHGLINEPDQDSAAEMYEISSEVLSRAGFIQYEISNWAGKSSDGITKYCLHNLQYWRNQPYLGFGAGAHGYANGMRIATILSPAAYIKRVSNIDPHQRLGFPRSPATVEISEIDRRTEMAETMMMGMRLTLEGVSEERFSERFGTRLDLVYGKEIKNLLDLGLVEWVGVSPRRLRITKNGRLLGNHVFREFL